MCPGGGCVDPDLGRHVAQLDRAAGDGVGQCRRRHQRHSADLQRHARGTHALRLYNTGTHHVLTRYCGWLHLAVMFIVHFSCRAAIGLGDQISP